jgi:hypothetical protein
MTEQLKGVSPEDTEAAARAMCMRQGINPDQLCYRTTPWTLYGTTAVAYAEDPVPAWLIYRRLAFAALEWYVNKPEVA